MPQHVVRLPPSKMFLKITKEKKKASKKLGALMTGDIVTVFRIIGDRAKIVFPIHGWCSTKNEERNVQYLYKTENGVIHDADPTCAMTKKALDLSRREYCRKQISMLESHTQVIRNQREASGRGDDMMVTMRELQERIKVFKEFLYPKLEWNCAECTYVNSPVYLECKMCKTPKSVEMIFAMSAPLQAMLSNKGDDNEGKKAAHLIVSAKEEKAVDSIEMLEGKVSELLNQQTKISGRMNELQESNIILADRITEVETTVKTCVDLSAVDPEKWSVTMVSAWLVKLGIQQYQEDFEDACVDGKKLLNCDERTLDKLDVRRKHRPLILNAITKLKENQQKLNVSRQLSSAAHSQQTKSICQTQNVQGLSQKQNVKVSSKPFEENHAISNKRSAPVSGDEFVDFSDEECDDALGWDIVGEEP